MKRTLLLMTILLSGLAFAAEPDSSSVILKPIWVVHVDRVDPPKVAEFERMVGTQARTYLDIQTAHGIAPRENYQIATEEHVYYTLRPTTSYAEFDKPSPLPDSVKKVVAAQVDSFDISIHKTLVDHHNEVWRYLQQLSHHPLNVDKLGAPPGYIHFVREKFRPDRRENYYAVIGELNKLKDSLSYPFPTVVFASSFGDGSYISITIAPSKEEFDQVGDREKYLMSVRDATIALEWRKKLNATLLDGVAVDATAPAALNPYAQDNGWPLK